MKSKGRRLFFRAVLLSLLTAFPPGCRETPRFDYDFEQSAILDELHWSCGTLFRLSAAHPTSGASSLEVTFFPGPPGSGETYPGLSLTEFDRNWSAYGTLVFDAFVPGEEVVRVVLRIDDRENPGYTERFNAAISLVPGRNHIAIPLVNVVASKTEKPLNINSIHRVSLFMTSPRERYTIFFDRLRVE